MIHTVFLGVLFGELLLGLFFLILCLLFPLPYGRHARSGWGPTWPARRAWRVMALPAALMLVVMYAVSGRNLFDPAMVFLFLWEAHYAYRLFFYPHLAPERRRSGFPALFVPAVVLFHVANGFINGYYLFQLPFAYGPPSFLSVRPLCGLAVFGSGLALHVWSDRILRDVRPEGPGRYGIPRRGPFRLVSCPNYLGEILQWIGWAVLTRSLPGLAIAWVTFTVLLPRAVSHHRWYRRRFDDYPKNRRALIPFLL